MADSVLEPDILQALEVVVTRLNTVADTPWLLSGPVAQVLQGVERQVPRELLILTGTAEIGRVAALLAADEVEPLAMRAVKGFAPSPRGRYKLPVSSGGMVEIDLVGDAQALGSPGTLSLALERIWPLRLFSKINALSVPLVPLEIELAIELLRNQHNEAQAIATYLQARGAQWDRLDPILAQIPALETPLWELMDVVRPLGKRARGKRIRRQTGWGGRRR